MPSILPLALFAATFSFACGIILPLIQVDRLFVFTDEPSLIGIVQGLWVDGNVFLALAIAAFSLLLPALKLLLLHLAAYAPRSRVPHWLGALSRWSMLDVVLVALVIFAAKTSGVATAFTRPGLWFFAASVVLTTIASHMLKQARADT